MSIRRLDSFEQGRTFGANAGRVRRQIAMTATGRFDPARYAAACPGVEVLVLSARACEGFRQGTGRWYLNDDHVFAFRRDGRVRYWPWRTVTPLAVAEWLGCPPPSVQTVRTVEKISVTEPDWESMFDDWRQALDWLVRVAWVERIPAGQKNTTPLAAWRIDPSCARPPQAAGLKAVADTLMDILTGHEAVRRPHPLGRDGKPVIGPWGNPVMRFDVSRRAPGPRLHGTYDPDGVFVLLDVSLHDDLLD